MAISKLVNKGGFTLTNSSEKFELSHAKLKHLFKVALDCGFFQQRNINPELINWDIV